MEEELDLVRTLCGALGPCFSGVMSEAAAIQRRLLA